MSKTIHAIYENGVFRPVDAVDIPENSKVEFEVRLIGKPTTWPENYFSQTAGSFEDEVFDRAPQGELPQRSDWQ